MIVLPNVHIWKKTIIGAGSVVTKDIPEYCIAVGNPAKVIKIFDIKEKKVETGIMNWRPAMKSQP